MGPTEGGNQFDFFFELLPHYLDGFEHFDFGLGVEAVPRFDFDRGGS